MRDWHRRHDAVEPDGWVADVVVILVALLVVGVLWMR